MTGLLRSSKSWSFIAAFLILILLILIAYAYYRHTRIKQLSEELKSSEPNSAQAAAKSLGGMGSDIVGYLIPTIKNMNSQSREYTAEALRPVAHSAVPALITVLDDEDVAMRGAAVEILGRIGPAAKDSVPALIGILKEGDERLRKPVKVALGEIKDPGAIEPLIETFGRDPLSDNTAQIALGKIGRPAIPYLVAKLKDRVQIRQLAVYALGEIGPAAAASEAVQALIELLDDREDNEVRERAIWALGRIKDKMAVTRLVELLQKKPPPKGVIAALSEIGRDAKDALPALKDMSWDDDKNLRKEAREAWGEISPESLEEIRADEENYERLGDAIKVELLPPAIKGKLREEGKENPKSIFITFRWSVVKKSPVAAFCSTLLIDKGRDADKETDPFDGGVGYEDNAKPNDTQLQAKLDFGEYYNSKFIWGVEVRACRDAKTDCNKPNLCVGRTFRSVKKLYTVKD